MTHAELLKMKAGFLNLLLNPEIHDDLKISLKDRAVVANFVGVGIGCRLNDNQTKPSLTALVQTKLTPKAVGSFNVKDLVESLQKLGADKLIKAGYENVDLWTSLQSGDVKVAEIGPVRSMGGLAGPVNQLIIGADVAMAGRATHGTVCGFAQFRSHEPDDVFLLSCGHVLDSRGCRFSLVTSRGAVVARIEKQLDLFPGPHRGPDPKYPQQDAVLAKLIGDVKPNFELPGEKGRLSSGHPQAACCNMSVTKVGKSVEEGQVVYTDVAVVVDYPSQRSWLDNQIIVESEPGRLFARPGDSGALVITRVQNSCYPGPTSQILPVGMVVAAGDPASLIKDGSELPSQFAIISPMKDILDALKVDLLP